MTPDPLRPGTGGKTSRESLLHNSIYICIEGAHTFMIQTTRHMFIAFQFQLDPNTGGTA